MKTLLEKSDELDRLIRQLHKLESKLRAGQIIDAWREINRIMAKLEADKQALIIDAAETIKEQEIEK